MSVCNQICTCGYDGTTNNNHNCDVNPLVKTFNPERQPNKKVTINAQEISYEDEWTGTYEEICGKLLCQFMPSGINSYKFRCGEQFVMSRDRGDMTRLVRTYKNTYHLNNTNYSNSIANTTGITPWQVRSETTDIGAIEYFMLSNDISTANQINRFALAQWDGTDLAHKKDYLIKTPTGWAKLNETCIGGTELTLSVAKFITETGRSTFPMTTARIIHTQLRDGKKRKESLSSGILEDLYTTNVDDDMSVLQFPDTFGKLLSTLPCSDKHHNFGLADKNNFFLDQYNVQNYNGKSQYLLTEEYVSYPKILPNPYPSVPNGPTK